MSSLAVPATYVRGGTSKAVFFHAHDLPSPGPLRDAFLIRMMGSPDLSQIDGMGGGKVVTSKAAILQPSSRPDADVDYTFVQVSLGTANITYAANCGNISSAVGPFAINEGLMKDGEGKWEGERRVVRIYNTGIDAILIAHVPVNRTTGRAREQGELRISGCMGSGAPILMDYSEVSFLAI